MKNKKISDNYINLIIKIIDYLSAEQEKNNTNELIPIIDIHSNSILTDVNEHFNEQIKMWKEYYSFQKLISTELLTEIEERKIYDGILISDLNLCKKRLINKELGDKNFGCIRVHSDNGIYFEETITKDKTDDEKKVL